MSSIRNLSFLLLSLLVIACGSNPQPEQAAGPDSLLIKAQELARRFIITDGHVDLPYMLQEKKVTISEATRDTLLSTSMGEFDHARAVKGGLDAPFMSIYIPVKDQAAPGYGMALADSLINQVEAIVRVLPEKFALAGTPDDIRRNTTEGKISLPMGMENGAPVGKDIARLQYLFDRGIRYITLTHNKDNQICDASNDTTHTWKGLSPFGRKVVAEMNRLGIMVDISHVDDSTFYQVMRLSKAPAIASHSSGRHFAPAAKRDMSDDMIKKMGEKGGVIMINYYPYFLDSAARSHGKRMEAYLSAKSLKKEDPAAKAEIEAFLKNDPWPVTVKTVADHIDRVVKLAGIDHVGLGSDYDGVDGYLPVGLEDVSTYPVLIRELLTRGYSEADIEKICSGNLFRVWDKVIDVSGGK